MTHCETIEGGVCELKGIQGTKAGCDHAAAIKVRSRRRCGGTGTPIEMYAVVTVIGTLAGLTVESFVYRQRARAVRSVFVLVETRLYNKDVDRAGTN
jgi:hypothetical protein